MSPSFASRHYDFHGVAAAASDIHIETRDDSVVIKFRIDGVLTNAMPRSAKSITRPSFRASRS